MSCAGCEDCTLSAPPSDAIPYEIHITAGHGPWDQFFDAVKSAGAKAVIIHNYIGPYPPVVCVDRLVSAKVAGTDRVAYDEMNRIQSALLGAGVDILRSKIETAPWHPQAERAGPDQYFECHLEVDAVTPDGVAALFQAAKVAGVSLSANPNKGLTYMATYRRYNTSRRSFECDLALIASTLTVSGFPPKRQIVEFTLFDSNVGHDARWMGA